MGGKTESVSVSGFRKLNETFVRLVGNLSKFVFESVELMGGKTESVSVSVSVSVIVIIRSGRDHDGE